MAGAVKKTISLPLELAREAEAVARREGKSLSAVVQEGLRLVHAERWRRQLRDIQGYWSQRARERGVLTDKDLERYLRR